MADQDALADKNDSTKETAVLLNEMMGFSGEDGVGEASGSKTTKQEEQVIFFLRAGFVWNS